MASKRYIPKAVRERVRTEGKRRCAYCQVPEVMTYHRLEMEHIIPRFSGGASEESNLCLSCRLCNESKGPQTRAKDPETGRTVALFHPKRRGLRSKPVLRNGRGTFDGRLTVPFSWA